MQVGDERFLLVDCGGGSGSCRTFDPGTLVARLFFVLGGLASSDRSAVAFGSGLIANDEYNGATDSGSAGTD